MEKETATKLINTLFIKSDKYSHYTSYYLKHIIEITASILNLPNAYLSNDEFKKLMIELGFERKQTITTTKVGEVNDDDIYKLKLVKKYDNYNKIYTYHKKIETLIERIEILKKIQLNMHITKKIKKLENELNKIELYTLFEEYYKNKYLII